MARQPSQRARYGYWAHLAAGFDNKLHLSRFSTSISHQATSAELSTCTDLVFWRNGWVHLNRRGRQFSRLLAAKVCASAVIMLDTPCSEVVWRELATHSIHQFPLHFPSRASPCAITFQLDSNFTEASSMPCYFHDINDLLPVRISEEDMWCWCSLTHHSKKMSEIW
jgi:hypothetical protein